MAATYSALVMRDQVLLKMETAIPNDAEVLTLDINRSMRIQSLNLIYRANSGGGNRSVSVVLVEVETGDLLGVLEEGLSVGNNDTEEFTLHPGVGTFPLEPIVSGIVGIRAIDLNAVDPTVDDYDMRLIGILLRKTT